MGRNIPMLHLSCSLLQFGIFLALMGQDPPTNLLDCLSSVVLSQCFWNFSNSQTLLTCFTVPIDMPQTILFCWCSLAEPFLASLLSSSFPTTPWCAGIHFKVTWLHNDDLLSSVKLLRLIVIVLLFYFVMLVSLERTKIDLLCFVRLSLPATYFYQVLG